MLERMLSEGKRGRTGEGKPRDLQADRMLSGEGTRGRTGEGTPDLQADRMKSEGKRGRTGKGTPDLQATLAVCWEAPGVQGEARSVERFGDAWCAITGRTLKPGMKTRVHALRNVVMPTLPPGRARPAEKPDTDILADWIDAFAEEVGTAVSFDGREVAESGIKTGRLWVWDRDGPVSIAAWAGPTVNSMRIGTVYTPPALRGKGYASAATASLSKRLLDQGFSFCCLYTDLANPISNKIYRRIGYEPVSDSNQYVFE